MTTPTAPTIPLPTSRDRWTYAGMLAVAVAAAVLSFSSLAGLAGLAGVTAAVPLPFGGQFRLAWLLPIAVDAYAVTATRVWLRTADAGGTARTRGYAHRNAVGAIVLSVAGNAAFHALTAAGVASLADVRAGWAVVVAVSAVPPVMLGLVGHLHALVSDDYRPTPAAPPSTAPAPYAQNPAPAGEPPAAEPTTAARTGTPRLARTGSRSGTRTGGRAAAAGRRSAGTDAELTAALLRLPREADGTVPIRRATAAVGCGPDRARRLLAGAGLLRSTTNVPDAENRPDDTTPPAHAAELAA